MIKWNGRSLQGKSFDVVSEIIRESRMEPQVELIVSRNLSSTTTGAMPAGPGPSTPMASRRIVAQSQWRQKHETISGPQQPHHKGDYARHTRRVSFYPSVFRATRSLASVSTGCTIAVWITLVLFFFFLFFFAVVVDDSCCLNLRSLSCDFFSRTHYVTDFILR